MGKSRRGAGSGGDIAFFAFRPSSWSILQENHSVFGLIHIENLISMDIGCSASADNFDPDHTNYWILFNKMDKPLSDCFVSI